MGHGEEGQGEHRQRDVPVPPFPPSDLVLIPELNPAESVWSNLRTKLFNFTACSIDELTALVKNRLKPMQYRPGLLNGFIAETGLMSCDLA